MLAVLKTHNTQQVGGILGQSFRNALKPSATFIDGRGSDPWVVYKGGWYYYCRTNASHEIVVNKTRNLKNVGKGNHVVWRHEINHPDAEVWAPELHYIAGKWYIYVTLGQAAQHRMYALEAVGDDPQGEYRIKGKVSDPTDHWAIDGTIMQHDGRLYFIWAGWETEEYGQENLYIAEMSNPWTISSHRVCISRPEYGWEKKTLPGRALINEGPQVLKHGDKTFIIYSASYATIDDYCLGQLELTGPDPLDTASWTKKPAPVFSKTEYCPGPGHASFVKRRDGTDWIVYHMINKESTDWARIIVAQKFSWNPDGTPNFGCPMPYRQGSLLLSTSRRRVAARSGHIKMFKVASGYVSAANNQFKGLLNWRLAPTWLREQDNADLQPSSE